MATEFKGTRGPWKVKPSTHDYAHLNIIGTVLGTKYKVAHVPWIYSNKISHDEAVADANLIAAAPDLLKALQGLLPICENICTDKHYYFNIAKLAINKALGL